MIFFDNNATTPILPEVVEAMMTQLDGVPRNPSSITSYGREGRARLSQARRQIADQFGLSPEEVIFTSGATESNHLLLYGFHAYKTGHIISSTIDHSSVHEPLQHLKAQVTYVEVGPHGAPTPKAIEQALRPDTALIFLTGANNETGVKIDLDAIGEIAMRRKIPLVIDGVVLLGRTSLFPLPSYIAAISFSGHKIHGPTGSGLALVRKQYKIPPLFYGGFQEHQKRAGTENLPAIVGLAKAMELLDPSIYEYLTNLRDTFEASLYKAGIPIEINGEGPRVGNTTCIYFPEEDGELLLIKMDRAGLIATVGAACSSGTIHASRVLRAMGYNKERIYGSLRFSFSRLNTPEEIKRSIEIIHNSLL